MKKEFLVCVDSDGCVFDGMTVKHEQCFGPALLEVWPLKEYEKEVLRYWDKINLYSITRGINRFLGLTRLLKYVNDHGWLNLEMTKFEEWVTTTKELSNKSLLKAVEQQKDQCMEQALGWSYLVNERVEKLEASEILPFEDVEKVLMKVIEIADIAIVSSANKEAVISEWKRNDLLKHVEVVMTQDNGSKAQCITQMIMKGYDRNKIIMIGDALGDQKAAQDNDVMFYPILVKKETESWHNFYDVYLDSFVKGNFRQLHMNHCTDMFLNNLREVKNND